MLSNENVWNKELTVLYTLLSPQLSQEYEEFLFLNFFISSTSDNSGPTPTASASNPHSTASSSTTKRYPSSNTFLVTTIVLLSVLFLPYAIYELVTRLEDDDENSNWKEGNNRYTVHLLLSLFQLSSTAVTILLAGFILTRYRMNKIIPVPSSLTMTTVGSMKAGTVATVECRATSPTKGDEESGTGHQTSSMHSTKPLNSNLPTSTPTSTINNIFLTTTTNYLNTFALCLSAIFVFSFAKDVAWFMDLENNQGNIMYNNGIYNTVGHGQELVKDLLVLCFLPMLYLIFLPIVNMKVIWSCVAMFIIVVLFYAKTSGLIAFIIYAIVVATALVIIVIELQLKNLAAFFVSRQMDQKISEAVQRAEENSFTETRHLIANVAHDLKTPLSSFITGIDFIEKAVEEFEQDLRVLHNTVLATTAANSGHASVSASVSVAMNIPCSNITPGSIVSNTSANTSMMNSCIDNIFSALSTIHYCVSNVRNTNSFMMMTINRCIDYTKASKGLKLVPKHETIDLVDTLQLPLSCMSNIQNRIEIKLADVPDGICTHIITDKQWLQENVLCLLSNAVKYSSEGIVTIRLSLEVSHKVVRPNQGGNTSSKHAGSEKGLSARSPSLCSIRYTQPVSSSAFPQESSASLARCNSFASEVGSLGGGGDDDRDHNEETFLRVEIEDTGIGMTDEARNALFSPFKQNQRLAGGTGLGLYSLAKRIDALYGRYGVLPRADNKQGSLFWFSFPYRPDQVTAKLYANKKRSMEMKLQSLMGMGLPASHGSQTCSHGNSNISINISNNITNSMMMITPNFSRTLGNSTALGQSQGLQSSSFDFMSAKFDGQKSATCTPKAAASIMQQPTQNAPVYDLLLADDSPAIVKMTTLMLKKSGHKVTTAENGAVAIQKVKQRWIENKDTFDAVLMDFQMPVMDGLEATKRIRQLEYNANEDSVVDASMQGFPHQIVIGLTANVDEDAMQMANESRFDAILDKPFKIDMFNIVMKPLFEKL